MPGLGDGIFTTGDNISATNPGHLGKLVGVPVNYSTRQHFINACGMSVTGQYAEGQLMTVADEAEVQMARVWRKNPGNALLVRFACGYETVLADMDRIVRKTSGPPPAGEGAENDVRYDPGTRTVYRRSESDWQVEKSEGLLFQASTSGNRTLVAADRDSVVRLSGTNTVTVPNLGQQFIGIRIERIAAGSTTPVAGSGVTLVPRTTGALAAITNDGSYYRIEPSGIAGKYYVSREGN